MNKEEVVIASDSEAIQTKPQMRSPSLDGFALLAMTDDVVIASDSERLFSDRPLAIGRKRHKTECAL